MPTEIRLGGPGEFEWLDPPFWYINRLACGFCGDARCTGGENMPGGDINPEATGLSAEFSPDVGLVGLSTGGDSMMMGDNTMFVDGSSDFGNMSTLISTLSAFRLFRSISGLTPPLLALFSAGDRADISFGDRTGLNASFEFPPDKLAERIPDAVPDRFPDRLPDAAPDKFPDLYPSWVGE
jgi:hypothetical protein